MKSPWLTTIVQFYSEAILSRRGPLAKVWLAAHMERKLSKTQTLQTDIEQSVGEFSLHEEYHVSVLDASDTRFQTRSCTRRLKLWPSG